MTDAPKIEFPCDYPIKVIGYAKEDFQQVVSEIVQRHCPEFDGSTVEVIDSRNGKFASLRFSIVANGEQHIHDLFVELKNHEYVQMVL